MGSFVIIGSFKDFLEKIQVLTKSNYTLYLSEIKNISAFSYYEVGAAGLPGWIIIVSDEGKVFGLNYVSEFIKEDINKILPVFSEIIFDPIGLNDIVPQNWSSLYMGMGAHLIMKDSIFGRFKDIAWERGILDYRKSDLQKHWIDITIDIISSTKSNVIEMKGGDTDNKISMPYHLMEVDFDATGKFRSLGDGLEEIWSIGDKEIVTPHGTLEILDAFFVEEGPLVGVQFSVDGYLKMNDFSCSKGHEDTIYVSTFALVRQPHNAWLWVYAFDEDNQPIANFCGFDDLAGLSNFLPFLKRRFYNAKYIKAPGSSI